MQKRPSLDGPKQTCRTLMLILQPERLSKAGYQFVKIINVIDSVLHSFRLLKNRSLAENRAFIPAVCFISVATQRQNIDVTLKKTVLSGDDVLTVIEINECCGRVRLTGDEMLSLLPLSCVLPLCPCVLGNIGYLFLSFPFLSSFF